MTSPTLPCNHLGLLAAKRRSLLFNAALKFLATRFMVPFIPNFPGGMTYLLSPYARQTLGIVPEIKPERLALEYDVEIPAKESLFDLDTRLALLKHYLRKRAVVVPARLPKKAFVYLDVQNKTGLR